MVPTGEMDGPLKYWMDNYVAKEMGKYVNRGTSEYIKVMAECFEKIYDGEASRCFECCRTNLEKT